MISLLKVLPKSLTTFLYAAAALLRFYGDSESVPFPVFRFSVVEWSLLVFGLATASLLVNLGLEWHAGNRERNCRVEEGNRAAEEGNRANQERERAAEEREKADRERNRADQERDRADQERDRADQERQRAARRARVQNRWIVLEIQHRLRNSAETGEALRDFAAFLAEYGE
ncbi:MAG: hypothetical protein GC158_02465 [Cyanobacteria bacterium RI_101]|nr:hypothetical protein [Cyanobacteria bacterium RI_101]